MRPHVVTKGLPAPPVAAGGVPPSHCVVTKIPAGALSMQGACSGPGLTKPVTPSVT